jgi:hypothetical protein
MKNTSNTTPTYIILELPRDINTFLENNTNKPTREKQYSCINAKIRKNQLKKNMPSYNKAIKHSIQILEVLDNRITGNIL